MTLAGRPVVIGHRGGDLGPENTLLAIRRAAEVGVDGVEVDVRPTRDGRHMAIHDDALDRTSPDSGMVADHTPEELRSVDVGQGERLSTLGEVADTVRTLGLTLLLDVKATGVDPDGQAEALARDLAEVDPELDLVVSSFSLPLLRSLDRERPGTRLAPIVSLRQNVDITRDVSGPWAAVSVLAPLLLRPGLVERAHAGGVAVHAWFGWTESVVALRAAMARGVDGLIVRHVRRAVSLCDHPG